MTLYALSLVSVEGGRSFEGLLCWICINGVSGKLPVAHTTVIMTCNSSLRLCVM
jgi:hypothetical protein